MVNSAFKTDQINEYIATHQSQFNWVSLPVQEIVNNDLRLEASVYATEAEKAKLLVLQNKYGVIPLSKLIDTNHCPRFKRVFVDQSDLPIYQPSQIKELNPLPAAYISDRTATNVDALRVKKGQILMTCSGTVGKVTLVSDTLDNYIFSHDLLRINLKDSRDAGFLYTYFLSKVGRSIITANNYGAVIKHIEPAHLLSTPVPNIPLLLRNKLNDLIQESFELRDKANKLIRESYQQLKDNLGLEDISNLMKKKDNNPFMFNISVKDIQNRLEAKFHHPIVATINNIIKKNAKSVTDLSDKKIVKSILLPGRYKRYYVEPAFGVAFLGGKEVLDLDPRGEKYLSLKLHKDRILKELTLSENMILVTRSGTIGKVTLVPQHWSGWTATEDILRIIPISSSYAGYLYAWLSSEWGRTMIERFTYGAVIFHIDDEHLSKVPVPLIEMNQIEEINNKVLEANRLRTKAFNLEQEALDIFNKQLLRN